MGVEYNNLVSVLNTKYVIRTENLIKDYRIAKDKFLRVLNGISIGFLESEIVSIVGASGAGKSTLLHLLGALDRPTSGKIYYEEEDILNFSSDKLASLRNTKIGFVFQFHHLLPEFTAIENVSIASMISGKSIHEVRGRAESLLQDVGLGGRLEHRPNELSGGEAQRVAVARSLMNSPGVVLMDEPTGNLDTKNSEEIIRLIFDLREKYKQTFVIVTHNESFATITDRSLKMVDGRIIND